MPRCGRLRSFIKEYNESPRVEKLSFVVPFLILTLEIILLTHAIFVEETIVIILTSILLLISLVEIILVTGEMHAQYLKSNFDKILTIRLDDFVIEGKEKNVKKIVTDFIEKHPEYYTHRNEIYHTTCQILETHKEEEIEKEIETKLKPFIKRNKKANVDDIVEKFVKKYPKYRNTPSLVYEKTCKIMGSSE
jgi:hypothetical protein